MEMTEQEDLLQKMIAIGAYHPFGRIDVPISNLQPASGYGEKLATVVETSRNDDSLLLLLEG